MGDVPFLLPLFQSQSCLAFWDAAVIPKEIRAENCEDFLPRCLHSMFCFMFLTLSFGLKTHCLNNNKTPKVLALISEDRHFLASKQKRDQRDKEVLYNRGHNVLLTALYQSGLSGYGDKQPSGVF